MAPVTSKFSVVSGFCVGGIPGTCMAGWCHDGDSRICIWDSREISHDVCKSIPCRETHEVTTYVAPYWCL